MDITTNTTSDYLTEHKIRILDQKTSDLFERGKVSLPHEYSGTKPSFRLSRQMDVITSIIVTTDETSVLDLESNQVTVHSWNLTPGKNELPFGCITAIIPYSELRLSSYNSFALTVQGFNVTNECRRELIHSKWYFPDLKVFVVDGSCHRTLPSNKGRNYSLQESQTLNRHILDDVYHVLETYSLSSLFCSLPKITYDFHGEVSKSFQVAHNDYVYTKAVVASSSPGDLKFFFNDTCLKTCSFEKGETVLPFTIASVLFPYVDIRIEASVPIVLTLSGSQLDDCTFHIVDFNWYLPFLRVRTWNNGDYQAMPEY